MTKHLRGFTLIESIIVIIVMGIAMLTIVHFLSPQITRSADPHYQSRASALGQSLMSQILSRNFDEQNNQLGGGLRCDTSTCSGFTSVVLGPDGTETPSQYNDVDDFIGCWTTSTPLGACKDLNLLLNDSGADSSYHNFYVDIAVSYAPPCTPSAASSCGKMLKKIDMTITAGKQPPFTLTAYRGNY
ncbi:type II secretion system protein [Vibrio intestinalis]|uniref:type II secretion system protein n=1 Tax=Vibrio intestinalis TaxID=2933291 RepID=UPI0021A82BC7|nr:type II secretion system protein [Vibrio intestinalis]